LQTLLGQIAPSLFFYCHCDADYTYAAFAECCSALMLSGEGMTQISTL
jgi:hypothetical protein